MAKKKQSNETGLAVGLDNLYFDANPPRVGIVASVTPDPAPGEDGASPDGASSSDGEASDHHDSEATETDIIAANTEERA